MLLILLLILIYELSFNRFHLFPLKFRFSYISTCLKCINGTSLVSEIHLEFHNDTFALCSLCNCSCICIFYCGCICICYSALVSVSVSVILSANQLLEGTEQKLVNNPPHLARGYHWKNAPFTATLMERWQSVSPSVRQSGSQSHFRKQRRRTRHKGIRRRIKRRGQLSIVQRRTQRGRWDEIEVEVEVSGWIVVIVVDFGSESSAGASIRVGQQGWQIVDVDLQIGQG